MCDCGNKFMSWDSNRELFYCTKCGEELTEPEPPEMKYDLD